MYKAIGHTFLRCVICLLWMCCSIQASADDGKWLDRKIQMKESRDTRYELLKKVSEKTGFLFMYDSQVVNNDQVVRIHKGKYTLRTLIALITGNEHLNIRLIDSHILLSLPPREVTTEKRKTVAARDSLFTISGTVYDRYSRERVTSATVSINRVSIGTVTNMNGVFRIILPDSLSGETLKISHVGYENQEIAVSSMINKYSDFLLEPKVIPLQEVIIRIINPVQELRRMLATRELNYSPLPVYLTAFYREGIEHKKKNVDLTEAVLKVYKTGYKNMGSTDQVKVIKMRRVVDKQEKDTILTRFKSGIQTALTLDMMKNIPDFLQMDELNNPFKYTHTDISVVDNRLVNVISFEQEESVKLPLHKGELYIDMENHALLEARFKINPKYAEQATSLYVEKSSKLFKFTLDEATYKISYKPLEDGLYYISHVRGDVEFKVRKKRRLFSSTLKVWFELVNCKVDTENVHSFSKSDRIPTRSVFSETEYVFDPGFWENFNVIVPEDKLRELIVNNLNEIANLLPE